MLVQTLFPKALFYSNIGHTLDKILPDKQKSLHIPSFSYLQPAIYQKTVSEWNFGKHLRKKEHHLRLTSDFVWRHSSGYRRGGDCGNGRILTVRIPGSDNIHHVFGRVQSSPSTQTMWQHENDLKYIFPKTNSVKSRMFDLDGFNPYQSSPGVR